MELSAQTALVYRLAVGGSLRLERGETQLLFDRTSGLCRVAVLRGGEKVREEVLGLGVEARVVVEPRLPERPVVLELDPVVHLAPGGWLRGYVGVPLHWSVSVQGARGEARLLEKLDADELRLGFMGPGGYAHPFPCRLRPRRFFDKDPTRALMALHLCSRGVEWREVRRLYLPLGGVGLYRLGDLFLTRPVRVRFEKGGPRLQVRRFYGRPVDQAREAAS